MSIQIEKLDSELRLTCPYDARFLQAFKNAIPSYARKWDKPAWIISRQFERQLLDLVDNYYGPRSYRLIDHGGSPAVTQTLERECIVEYIGACKERDDKTTSAYGYWRDGWNIIFPQDVLQKWFKVKVNGKSTQRETFYEILGLSQDCPETDLKPAYRRLARLWHPDVNSEPDAADRFRAIDKAYKALSDAVTRRKYDVGLRLEELSKTQPDPFYRHLEAYYRAPLTCGRIKVRGIAQLGRLLVQDILAWEDIVSKSGKILVSSWPKGAEMFEKKWIIPDLEVEI